jgi:hypothetical protein
MRKLRVSQPLTVVMLAVVVTFGARRRALALQARPRS